MKLFKPPLRTVKRKPITITPRRGSNQSLGNPKIKKITPPINNNSNELYSDRPYSLPKITTAIAIPIIITLLIYFMIPKTINCNVDDICFIEKANECDNARLTTTIGDESVIEFRTKNCILTKEIIKFSETEPKDFINLLKNKKMNCPYLENEFNENLILGLSYGANECTGKLKDTLEELTIT